MSNKHRLTLSTEQQTPLDFDAEIKGSNEDVSIYLYIKTDNLCLGFECRNQGESSWSVTIPPLSKYIDKGRYDFCVCVYIDKYCFTPINGKARVTDGKAPAVSIHSEPEQQDSEHQQPDSQEQEQDVEQVQHYEPEHEQQERTVEQSNQTTEHQKKNNLTFFSSGSPKQLAERIRSMPLSNETDQAVKRILSDYKSKHKH